jgi:hypothetical protein
MADEEEQDTGWGLKLAFDSDDPQFVRGFNAGTIYGWLVAVLQRIQETGMRSGATLIPPFYARAENAEMVIRIAEGLGLQARVKSETGDHLEIVFHRRPPPLSPPG